MSAGSDSFHRNSSDGFMEQNLSSVFASSERFCLTPGCSDASPMNCDVLCPYQVCLPVFDQMFTRDRNNVHPWLLTKQTVKFCVHQQIYTQTRLIARASNRQIL